MSWKFVLNSNNLMGKTCAQIALIAKEAGYEFFTFNGDVFFYVDGKYYKTQLTVKDLY